MNKNKSKDKKNEDNKKIKILRFFLIFLIIIWAIIVFNFSNQNGEESAGLSQKFVELFIKQKEVVNMVEPIVRKIAHFSEYAIGGVLFILLFYTYTWSNKKRILISILLGIWYAITDEFHQTFIPERHGSIIDILIDSLGVITGIIIVLIIIKISILVKNKKQNNKNI